MSASAFFSAPGPAPKSQGPNQLHAANAAAPAPLSSFGSSLQSYGYSTSSSFNHAASQGPALAAPSSLGRNWRFPSSRKYLWDRTPSGKTQYIELKERLPVIEVAAADALVKHITKNQSKLQQSANGCTVLPVLGARLSLDMQHRLYLALHPAPVAADGLGTSDFPGDLMPVPCTIRRDSSSQSACAGPNGSAGAADAASASAARAAFRSALDRRGQGQLGQLMVAACTLQPAPDSQSIALSGTLMVPAPPMAVTPLFSKRLCDVPLAQQLVLPKSVPPAAAASLPNGFVTMDQSRSLLPLAADDPVVYSVPLVGVWVHGTSSPSHPLVVAACLRFAYSTTLPDRATQQEGSFLLLLFPAEGAALPLCFECRFHDNAAAARGGAAQLELLQYVFRGEVMARHSGPLQLAVLQLDRDAPPVNLGAASPLPGGPHRSVSPNSQLAAKAAALQQAAAAADLLTARDSSSKLFTSPTKAMKVGAAAAAAGGAPPWAYQGAQAGYQPSHLPPGLQYPAPAGAGSSSAANGQYAETGSAAVAAAALDNEGVVADSPPPAPRSHALPTPFRPLTEARSSLGGQQMQQHVEQQGGAAAALTDHVRFMKTPAPTLPAPSHPTPWSTVHGQQQQMNGQQQQQQQQAATRDDQMQGAPPVPVRQSLDQWLLQQQQAHYQQPGQQQYAQQPPPPPQQQQQGLPYQQQPQQAGAVKGWGNNLDATAPWPQAGSAGFTGAAATAGVGAAGIYLSRTSSMVSSTGAVSGAAGAAQIGNAGAAAAASSSMPPPPLPYATPVTGLVGGLQLQPLYNPLRANRQQPQQQLAVAPAAAVAAGGLQGTQYPYAASATAVQQQHAGSSLGGSSWAAAPTAAAQRMSRASQDGAPPPAAQAYASSYAHDAAAAQLHNAPAPQQLGQQQPSLHNVAYDSTQPPYGQHAAPHVSSSIPAQQPTQPYNTVDPGGAQATMGGAMQGAPAPPAGLIPGMPSDPLALQREVLELRQVVQQMQQQMQALLAAQAATAAQAPVHGWAAAAQPAASQQWQQQQSAQPAPAPPQQQQQQVVQHTGLQPSQPAHALLALPAPAEHGRADSHGGVQQQQQQQQRDPHSYHHWQHEQQDQQQWRRRSSTGLSSGSAEPSAADAAHEAAGVDAVALGAMPTPGVMPLGRACMARDSEDDGDDDDEGSNRASATPAPHLASGSSGSSWMPAASDVQVRGQQPATATMATEKAPAVHAAAPQSQPYNSALPAEAHRARAEAAAPGSARAAAATSAAATAFTPGRKHQHPPSATEASSSGTGVTASPASSSNSHDWPATSHGAAAGSANGSSNNSPMSFMTDSCSQEPGERLKPSAVVHSVRRGGTSSFRAAAAAHSSDDDDDDDDDDDHHRRSLHRRMGSLQITTAAAPAAGATAGWTPRTIMPVASSSTSGSTSGAGSAHGAASSAAYGDYGATSRWQQQTAAAGTSGATASLGSYATSAYAATAAGALKPASDIVRARVITLDDDDSGSSDSEMDMQLMRKYGIR